MAWPDPAALAGLEARVERALADADPAGLTVLGYGEISAVLRLDGGGESWACKRLPPFRPGCELEAYQACLEDYLATLGGLGVRVLPTALVELERPGARVAYVVQPVVPAESLLPAALERASSSEAVGLFGRLVEAVERAVGPRVGLDGQVSNWAVFDDRLVYLDVTTPMLRDERGAERLDTELFLASLPWALRRLVRRFLLREILDKYYRPRGVVVDALANLVKEGLDRLLPALVETLGARLSPPVTVREVRRAYAADARMWQLLQRLRLLDRAWHRRVRGRTYPFLLPARIERHV
ncbi:MAG TPA: DUF6206 family protein [Anaeromyxobacter sp.]|nr:DUF6206 family protein [Anaeromyxobacter sp.]